MLSQYAKVKGFSLGNLTKQKYLEAVMKKYGFRDWDSVLAAVGHGGLKEGQVLNKLLELYNKDHKAELTDEKVLEAASENNKEKIRPHKGKSGIIIKGMNDLNARYPKCCNPLPGDEIVAYVTRGRGVTIHRTDCVNVLNMSAEERQRLMEAEWESTTGGGENEQYTAEITIYAYNRTGLIVDVSKIFTERKIDISSINTRTSKQGIATISLAFDVKSKEELQSLITKIRQIESVKDIERTTG